MPAGRVAIKISTRDLMEGSLVVLQQKGRTLPVAAARFMSQLIDQLTLDGAARE